MTVTALHLFLLPFTFCFPVSRKLSYFAAFIQYIPIIIIALLIFWLVNIFGFLLPAFLKALYQKFSLLPCCCPRDRRPRVLLLAVLEFIFFLGLGLPLYLCIIFFCDTPHLLKDLFSRKKGYISRTPSAPPTIPESHWTGILELLKSKYHRTPIHRAVSVSRVNLDIRELFHYSANYADFAEIVKGGLDNRETQIFMQIKHFLSRNSVEIF